MSEYEETDYGFKWGPAEVQRTTRFDRGKAGLWRVIQVKTPTKTLDIYISPTGRSVRVFSEGMELTPRGPQVPEE